MKISALKVIKSDYLALLFLLAPLATIIIYIDSAYFGVLHLFLSKGRSSEPLDPAIFLIMAIATTCVFIPLLIFRIKRISNHFLDGIEVQGKIVLLKLWKDRGRVEFTYEIGGKSYQTGNAVHKSKFVNSLAEGQKISIIVAKNNHEKALIKDMYI